MAIKKIFSLFLILAPGLITQFVVAQHLSWYKNIGGTGRANLGDVTYDAAGNIIISGWLGDTVDFDPSSGVVALNNQYCIPSSCPPNAFLSKYDPGGNLVWVEQFSIASGLDPGEIFIAAYPGGDIIATGRSAWDIDLDPGPDTAFVYRDPSGPWGVPFLARYNSNGGLIWKLDLPSWSRYPDLFVGSGQIALDSSGNIYLLGSLANQADFGNGVVLTADINDHSYRCMFIVKFDSNGNVLWGKNFGDGSYSPRGDKIVTDQAGNIYLSGTFSHDIDIDPGPASQILHASGVQNHTFLAAFDFTGALKWAKNLGANAKIYSMTFSGANRVIAAGSYNGPMELNPGGVSVAPDTMGSYDGFIAAYDTSGAYVNSYILADTGTQWFITLAKGLRGNLLAGAGFRGILDFDPTTAVQLLSGEQDEDPYSYHPEISLAVCELTEDLNMLRASKLGIMAWLPVPNSAPPFMPLIPTSTEKFYVIGRSDPRIDIDPGSAKLLVYPNTTLIQNFFIALYDTVCYTPTLLNLVSLSDSVCLGRYELFETSGTGSGNTTYEWYLNGNVIAGHYSENLAFLSNDFNSNDVFSCRVTNECGTVLSNSLPVFIFQNPLVIGTTGSDTICTGETIMLQANVTGTGPMHYSWKLDGTYLPGANSATYSKTNASIQDGGWYNCEIYNQCRLTYSPAQYIAVDTLPYFDLQVPVTSVCEGESKSISIGVSGGGQYTFQWMKNGSNINWIQESTYFILTTSLQDSGYYACRVTNQCGTSTSPPTFLRVTAKPPRPTVTRNGNSLVSSATSGNQWFESFRGTLDDETSQVLIPGASGTYFVIVTQGVCDSDPSSPVYFAQQANAIEEPDENISGILATRDGIWCMPANELNSKLRLFDVTGKLLHEAPLIGKSFFDMHDFSRGCYLVELISYSSRKTIRFIKY